MFDALAAWVEAKKANNVEGIAKAHANIRKAIDETYALLSKAKVDAESEVDSIKKRLCGPIDACHPHAGDEGEAGDGRRT